MTETITTENIEHYRGSLTIVPASLDAGMWDVFDIDQYNVSSEARIVPINQIVSTKNQLLDDKFLKGLKPDPRQSAFELMLEAVAGKRSKRGPLSVSQMANDMFAVEDGNATVQVLMFAGWKEVPVILKAVDHQSLR